MIVDLLSKPLEGSPKLSSGWLRNGSQQWTKEVPREGAPSEHRYRSAGKTRSKKLKRFPDRTKVSELDEPLASAALIGTQMAPTVLVTALGSEALEEGLDALFRARSLLPAAADDVGQLIAGQRSAPLPSSLIGVNLFARPLLSRMMEAKEEGDVVDFEQARSQLLGGVKLLTALDAVESLDQIGRAARVRAHAPADLGPLIERAAASAGARRLLGGLGAVAGAAMLTKSLRPQEPTADVARPIREGAHMLPVGM